MGRRSYRKIGPGFLDSAPIQMTLVQELPCSPERLFEVFEDAEAWTEWLFLDRVEWTCEFPLGEGSSRTVWTDGAEFDEVFFDWTAPEHFSFYFESGTSGMFAAFMEDYLVEPTDNGCRLTWRISCELAGIWKMSAPVFKTVFESKARKGLKDLVAYV